MKHNKIASLIAWRARKLFCWFFRVNNKERKTSRLYSCYSLTIDLIPYYSWVLQFDKPENLEKFDLFVIRFNYECVYHVMASLSYTRCQYQINLRIFRNPSVTPSLLQKRKVNHLRYSSLTHKLDDTIQIGSIFR